VDLVLGRELELQAVLGRRTELVATLLAVLDPPELVTLLVASDPPELVTLLAVLDPPELVTPPAVSEAAPTPQGRLATHTVVAPPVKLALALVSDRQDILETTALQAHTPVLV
jgi:hypothetical protein